MTRYLFAGLHIASELPVPEWTVFEEAEPFEADVTIRYGRSAMAPPGVGEASLIGPDEYRFGVPEAGR
jgi:hypothetical protein